MPVQAGQTKKSPSWRQKQRFPMTEKTETDLIRLSRRYLAALQRHQKQRPQSGLQSANKLGQEALAMGLGTLDMARIHEEALTALVCLNCTRAARKKIVVRAEAFFVETLIPIETTHVASRESKGKRTHLNENLDKSARALFNSNLRMKQEVVKRKAIEQALRKTKHHYGRLLDQSRTMQERLRKMSQQVLTAQEEERKRISRELHDEIAQALTAVHVHLSALESEESVGHVALKKRIARTQRLVEKSVETVHRFAIELRPALLDDLGLVPALRSHINTFVKQSGIQVHYTISPKIEKLNSLKRSVLYRVIQEALTNVAKHGEATLVKLSIRILKDTVHIEIADNGKSFDVKRVLARKNGTHLGLMGMQERIQMVGGDFTIDSAPDEGTTLRARIPFANGNTLT